MGRRWTSSQEAAMTLRGKTLLVSAAAGSGKTSVLTERIIRSLTDQEAPADLSRILVVTFTRAAAAELKGRIAEALTKAMAERPGDERLTKQMLKLGSADISTIDAFFQRTVRANFEQLGLPATFRIADTSEILPISTEILDGLIEEFYEKYAASNNTETPLGRITQNAFAEAMDHLMSNRSDGKLNSLLLSYYEKFTSYPEGIELIRNCAEDLRKSSEKEFFETKYGDGIRTQLQEQFTEFEKDLQCIRDSLEFDPDISLKCHDLLSSDLAFCRAILEALNEKRYTRVQSVANAFVSGRFPTIRNKPAEVAHYQEWRALFRKWIGKAQEKLKYPTQIISRQMLRTADFADILYQFYSEYQSRFMAEKRSRGILEHNDVRAMLYRLLTLPNGTPSPFAESLAANYDAVYIDEYQDVDLMQDRIFSLIGENRRFMVGDIKQSIYGFRGSDPSIFAGYRRAMPLYTGSETNDSNGVCVFMSENFRCNRPVIDFANKICAFLFSACEKSVGYRKQDDLVCAKSAPEKEPAPVRVAVFDRHSVGQSEDDTDEDVSADEAVWTAAEISRLLREEVLDNGKPVKPSDIAILVRNKAHGIAFAKELEALHIPVASEVAQDFLHEPLTTDVLNLLRAVDNPYRDIPLSEFLLSPLGGFTLAELTELRAAAPDHKALFDAMNAKACSEEADELSQKNSDILAWFEKLRANAAILPADRFLRLLYLDERLIAYANDPILLFLYDQARIYQRSSWCGLYGFLNHVNKLLDGDKVSAAGFAKAESAVTVMTVHHSKGLEFPVVFLCSCGSYFNRSDTYETLMYHKEIGCAAKLYNAETGEIENTVLREAVGALIDAEQTEESIRTLYVALTRARERLYVTGTLAGKWEKALSNASLVRRGNRSSILGCNSYLSWILAALQEKTTDGTETSYILEHPLHEEIIRGVSLKPETVSTSETKPLPRVIDPEAAHYAEVCKKQQSFCYALSALQGLPTKAAASKIQPNLLDVLTNGENQEDSLETQIELMRNTTPSFAALLNEHNRPSAADIGTATHTFLEFCDFHKLFQNGIEEECQRLISFGFIDPSSAQIIHREQLEGFIKSNLMKWIREAVEVRREQKFGIFVPLAELTADVALAERLGEHSLFVQGSIDLLLKMPNGKALLIDYKTDRITDEERTDREKLISHMKEKHGSQLSYYARAVKELFGKAPDQTFIYSLPLGEAIEIPLI